MKLKLTRETKRGIARILLFLTGFYSGCVSLAHAAVIKAEHPNIVLILADDLGYSSVGCFGANPSLVRTPNIDRLAKEGTRFTDASTPASVCTPTRYGILTGRYCWRSSLKFETLPVYAPLLIEPTRPTIASILHQQGYLTGAIGKWHIGYGTAKHADFTKPLDPGPLEVGFDYFFGLPQNNGDATGVYVENHGVVGLRSSKVTPSEEKTHYGPPYAGFDAPRRVESENMVVLGDRALDWLKTTTPQQPFFLYLAPTAVHEPIWPSKTMTGTSQAGPFGDFIHDLDGLVGRVLQFLDANKLGENTIVIFTSDNGGVLPFGSGDKNPSIRQAIGAGLKMNGDWRGGKHSVYEGGFKVPFIARWPDRIKAGAECSQMISLVDLFATLSELTGRNADEGTRGGDDSVSFLPLLLGRTAEASRGSMILHSAKGNFAIRKGGWKYIEGSAHPDVPPAQLKRAADEYHPQLYDLRLDPGETKDVSADHPELVAELAKLLNESRNQSGSRQIAATKPAKPSP